MTFERLLNMSDDFKAYELQSNNRVGIIIQSKRFRYEMIKKQSLAQYCHILTANNPNMITVIDLNMG
jgi:hypothetical protein